MENLILEKLNNLFLFFQKQTYEPMTNSYAVIWRKWYNQKQTTIYF